MEDFARRVKERVDIVEIVGRYVKLTRAGKNLKGLSPFKKERTPSFFVSPDKQVFYCFASGKGGDVFTFIQEVERLDFRGALELLAKEAGISLPQRGVRASGGRFERWHAVLEAAARWFEAQLAEHEPARAYLATRGVLPETARRFRIGYAPPVKEGGWDALIRALQRQGFTQAEIQEVGLASVSRKGTMIDLFRGRIMFPFFDVAGRVVGFSGRRFPDDDNTPKYLNTPETPLFKKGELLYPWHLAREAIRRHECAILVEGQVDVVLAHQAGWSITVAASGTGFTESHAAALTRLTPRIILALDADEAGRRAISRVAPLLLRRHAQLRILLLPPERDPADLIATEGAERWRRLVRESCDMWDVVVTWALQDSEVGVAVRTMVVPLIAAVASPIERALVIKRVAEALNLPEEAMREEVAVYRSQQAPLTPPISHADSTSGVDLKVGRREQLTRIVAAVLREGPASLKEKVRAILPSPLEEQLVAAHFSDASLAALAASAGEEKTFERLALGAAYEVVWLASKDAYATAARAVREAEERGASEEEITLLLAELEAARKRVADVEAMWRSFRES